MIQYLSTSGKSWGRVINAPAYLAAASVKKKKKGCNFGTSSAKAVGAVVKALSPNVVVATSAASMRRDTSATSQMMSINSVNSDTSFVNVGGANSVGGASNGGGANNGGDVDKVEKKFADLKPSIMEKVQPSST
jgi:hypothetical protein